MEESPLCPECGAPPYITEAHLWLNNGDIVSKRTNTERLVFFESENLDPLMLGIEETIGASIEHIVISSYRQALRVYVEGLLPDNVNEIVRSGAVDLKSVDDGFRALAKPTGLGRYEFVEMRYEQADDDFFTVNITEPYSLPICAAGHAAVMESVLGYDHGVTYAEVAPDTFKVTAFPSPHPEGLKGRMAIRPYQHEDGNIEFERCGTCGGPKALSDYQWYPDRGVILHKKTGRRMALQGPNELEPVFQELQAELGDTIPAAVVESQRRLTRTGLYPDDMLGDIDESRAQLALRGLGSLKDLKVDRQGLRMRLDNTALHLIIVGMIQGLFELAYNTDSEVDYEFNDQSDLELEVKPRE